MTIAPPQLTLYLLGQYAGPDAATRLNPMTFAPHGWKTLLDLRWLGAAHTVEYVTLSELRKVLPGKFDKVKVTLPTLVVSQSGSEDQIIMDSQVIAHYLETKYASSNKSIFSAAPTSPSASNSGRQYAKFIEHWVDRSLADTIRPCVLHTCYATFPSTGPTADIPSRLAFLAKCGQPKLDELLALNANEEWVAKQNAMTRKELGTIEVVLRERDTAGEEGVFLGGVTPGHADFCVFAFYAYSRSNSPLIAATWHHESLPFVQKWIKGFFEIGLVEKGEVVELDSGVTDVIVV